MKICHSWNSERVGDDVFIEYLYKSMIWKISKDINRLNNWLRKLMKVTLPARNFTFSHVQKLDRNRMNDIYQLFVEELMIWITHFFIDISASPKNEITFLFHKNLFLGKWSITQPSIMKIIKKRTDSNFGW